MLAVYGYWAVLVRIALQSTGATFLGEVMLLVAAIYAGTAHRLTIVLMRGEAACEATRGDDHGYWVRCKGSEWLLRCYQRNMRLDEHKLTLGQYRFRQHSRKVIVVGRFVAVRYAWAARTVGGALTSASPYARLFVPIYSVLNKYYGRD